MRPIYIFDLDGTLADCSHRLHFIQGEQKDWRSFFAACSDDKPIKHTINLLRGLRKAGAEVWVWTGRSDEAQAQTEEWLYEHGVLRTTMFLHWEPFTPPEAFLMRKAGDRRHDDTLKAEWLWQLEPPKYERLLRGGVFEDRQRVVDMWRRNGIPCYQVAPGDF